MIDEAQQTRRRFLSSTACLLLASSFSTPLIAATSRRKAPQWDISEWINADAGNVDSLRGKVIIIDFFQLWCPGCNRFSGPLMKHWQQKFNRDIKAGGLVLVKIHTVFEGHGYQTVERLKSYVKEKGVTMPVGIDRHLADQRLPVTMRRYRTRGTPEMVIIDKDGMIRFQKFGFFDADAVEPLITRLL